MRLKKPSSILVLLGMGLLTLILIAPTISATINAIHCKDNSKIMFWSVKPDLILSSGHIEVTCADGSGTVYRPVPPALESASQVRFSPDGKRVAFVDLTRQDYNEHIFVMNSDGSHLVRLSNTYSYDDGPAWSPDSQQLAFYAYITGSPDEGIYLSSVACLDTGIDCAVKATHLGPGAKPTWSPDGQHIAFEADEKGNFEIYSMNVDGSGRRNLTQNGANDSSPSWSPTGNSIAFFSSRKPEGIYVMNTDGSTPTYLMEGFFPTWSRDGRYIALISDLNTTNRIPVLESNIAANALFLISADGKETIRLTPDDREHITEFAWIP